MFGLIGFIMLILVIASVLGDSADGIANFLSGLLTIAAVVFCICLGIGILSML